MVPLQTILRAQRGRYLWGLRVGEGSLLSWQVGDAHLHVEMGRSVDGLDQRFAEPRGKWQVEVLDGEVLLKTPAGSGTIRAEEAPSEELEELLELLEGQALVSCELGESLALRFDLEAELVVSGARAWVRSVGPEGEGEWNAE
ncbi:MAG: hypothetical protein JJ863_18665 [Deltaproteobacteria bacterium]|nr:hypothetical protein [Deltaproteobacteria bacterium]